MSHKFWKRQLTGLVLAGLLSGIVHPLFAYGQFFDRFGRLQSSSPEEERIFGRTSNKDDDLVKILEKARRGESLTEEEQAKLLNLVGQFATDPSGISQRVLDYVTNNIKPSDVLSGIRVVEKVVQAGLIKPSAEEMAELDRLGNDLRSGSTSVEEAFRRMQEWDVGKVRDVVIIATIFYAVGGIYTGLFRGGAILGRYLLTPMAGYVALWVVGLTLLAAEVGYLTYQITKLTGYLKTPVRCWWYGSDELDRRIRDLTKSRDNIYRNIESLADLDPASRQVFEDVADRLDQQIRALRKQVAELLKKCNPTRRPRPPVSPIPVIKYKTEFGTAPFIYEY